METKEIIRELRTKKGLSQEELAEKIFVTRQAVSRWENEQPPIVVGGASVSISVLKALARVLTNQPSFSTIIGKCFSK